MVGLIAATGYDEIEVFKKPKVALLLLGDEIQLSGIPSDGLVRDSLGPQLPGWITKLGCEVAHIEYVPDDLDLTLKAINQATKEFDFVITTGGTADGPRDFLKIAVDKLNGSLIVDKVACRPGHPQVLVTFEPPLLTYSIKHLMLKITRLLVFLLALLISPMVFAQHSVTTIKGTVS